MLKIDPEFRALIPPLSPEERSGLEADIVRDGRATVPLIVWRDPDSEPIECDVTECKYCAEGYGVMPQPEHPTFEMGDGIWVCERCEHGVAEVEWPVTLIDGHNRYEICQAHGLPYTTQLAPEWIETIDDAKIWILQTSLNRRNLDNLTRIGLARQLEPLLAAKAKETQEATRAANQSRRTEDGSRIAPALAPKKSGEQDRHARETVAQAAAAAGVSHATYTAGKAVLDHGVPALQEKVKAKQVSISAAADIATLPRPEQAKVVALSDKEILARAKEIRSQKTEVRRQERVDNLVKIANGNRPLDTVARRYPVVYADPPWRYEHAETESRAIENQYPTMALDEICALPLSTITTPDAILFMWVTSPKLEEGMRVVREWGFTYRTCAVWDKEKIGMGYYFRQAHELLLVATKGSMPTPPPAARPSSVLRAIRGEHSAKPEEMRTMIEHMYPELPRVELFCRTPKDGWGVWGNQS